MFLARKINRAKWDKKEGLAEGEIPADAVTFDLRTTNNSLSFWECDSSLEGKESVKDVVLAMSAAGDYIETLQFIWLTDEELNSNDQKLDPSPGRTPVKDMVARHLEVGRLDCLRLGMVALNIATALEKKQYCRFTKKQVGELLVSAVDDGRVDLNDLSDTLQESVSKLLNSN